MKTLIVFNRLVRRLRRKLIYIIPCMILSLFFILVLHFNTNVTQTTMDTKSYTELVEKDKENIIINSEFETLSIVSKNSSILSLPKGTSTQLETMLGLETLKDNKEKNTLTINTEEKETSTENINMEQESTTEHVSTPETQITTEVNNDIVEETTEIQTHSSKDEYIYSLINEYSNNTTRIPLTYDNVYLLAQLSWAEAGNQPFNGKVAVCEVVLNRLHSDTFASSNYTSIRDVIFAPGQFSVVPRGTIYNIPTDECILAAVKAIAGEKPTNGALFFQNLAISTDFSVPNSRTKAITIGDHTFYY